MSCTLPTITALGTSWWIELFDEISAERLTVIHDDCEAFLRTFEQHYSRFAPDSCISQLNANKSLAQPTIELQQLLTHSLELYDRTNGVFNIMVGSTLIETGYDAAYSFTPSPERTPIENPHDVIHITHDRITLDRGQIDFGGFGKGYAIDALARILTTTYGLPYFLINGGGDMYATSDHGTPLTIYLEHPTEPNTYLTTTTLLNQGFAASSPHKRAWKHVHTTYTHIIDTTSPHGGERPDASFIKAATACDADVFATVALLVDPTTLQTLAAHNELGVACFYLASSSLTHNQAFIETR